MWTVIISDYPGAVAGCRGYAVAKLNTTFKGLTTFVGLYDFWSVSFFYLATFRNLRLLRLSQLLRLLGLENSASKSGLSKKDAKNGTKNGAEFQYGKIWKIAKMSKIDINRPEACQNEKTR